jgi:hypothetical protein
MDAKEQYDYVNSNRKLKMISKVAMDAFITEARRNKLLTWKMH